MPIVVDSIHRYPLKGLKGDSPAQIELRAQGIASDRRFGLAHAPIEPLMSGAEKWRPWNYCISLKKYERLARLRARFDDERQQLSVEEDDSNTELARADIHDCGDKARLAAAIADFAGTPPLTLVDCADKPLWDDAQPLSLVSAASVRALGDNVAIERFRPNIVFSGMAAWEEEGIRERFHIGKVRLAPAGGVPRCAATKVNPVSARADMNIPQQILQARGHNELGIFARIEQEGSIAAGMEILF